jgi:carotenoid cleavage dioxygenase-like enzyme
MTEHLDRRHFLAAATGLVATACASTKPKGTDATTATTDVATTTPSATTATTAATTTSAPSTTAVASKEFTIVRQNANAYLTGNYAPVTLEVTGPNLTVKGRLPKALNGMFVRNGPNPTDAGTGNYSWFGGDGMLHAITLRDGTASYWNKWVRTKSVAKFLGEPTLAATTIENFATPDTSNTNVVGIAGSLLTTTESALPYQVSYDGRTLGKIDAGGQLTYGLSAHTKFDPVANELHSISYRAVGAPFVGWTKMRPDLSGAVTVPIDVPDPIMIHTATLTPRSVVVYDLPVVFDAKVLTDGWPVPYAWKADHASRVGVIDRSTGTTTWIAIDPTFVFHDVSSHDTPTGLSVDLITYDKVFTSDLTGPFGNTIRVERWDIDTMAGQVRRTVLDDRPQEFPRVAPSTFGKAARYMYSVGLRSGDQSQSPGFGGVILKRDEAAKTTTEYALPRHIATNEAVFVPDPERASAEDGGWLMAFLYDATTDSSSFVVLDAQDLVAGPIATIELPQRVPHGFHGNWVPLP